MEVRYKRGCQIFEHEHDPAGIYLIKINDGNTVTVWNMFMWTIKAHSEDVNDVVLVFLYFNSEQISHIVLVFP